MRPLRLKVLIALSIVQFLFVSASLSHDENTPTGTGYHLHIEVRNVDDKDDLPLTTSRGADPDLSDPATEPICYLYAELLEDVILRNAGFAAPSRIRSTAETWGNLKVGN